MFSFDRGGQEKATALHCLPLSHSFTSNMVEYHLDADFYSSPAGLLCLQTPSLQKKKERKKKNPFFLHKAGGVLIRDMKHGYPFQSSLELLE